MPAQNEPQHPLLNLRTILEALILAGVLWVVKGVADLNVAMAEVRTRFAGVERLQTRVDALETRQANSEQAIAELRQKAEASRDRLNALERTR